MEAFATGPDGKHVKNSDMLRAQLGDDGYAGVEKREDNRDIKSTE